MELGEKIFKLRKEKGFSQENLAEKLGSTRQAVSKWENNQGYPDTEKLLMLSDIFEVSVDYLLKDEKIETHTEEKGYYVSREMAEGYLSQTKKISRYLGIGFLFWAWIGIPYILFQKDTGWKLCAMAVLGIIGICFFVAAAFSEQQKYKILEQETLLFDYEYRRGLSAEYMHLSKKYRLVCIPCTVIFISGLVAVMLLFKGMAEPVEMYSFIFLFLGAALLGLIYTASMMEAYELLVYNENHTSGMFFKLKRKIRKKLD